jgi:hypothetical protein
MEYAKIPSDSPILVPRMRQRGPNHAPQGQGDRVRSAGTERCEGRSKIEGAGPNESGQAWWVLPSMTAMLRKGSGLLIF